MGGAWYWGQAHLVQSEKCIQITKLSLNATIYAS
jgi:hypothetical protein